MSPEQNSPRREFTVLFDGHPFGVVAEGQTITINGRSYTVEVADGGLVFVDGIAYHIEWEGAQAVVDGQPFAVEVQGMAAVAPPRQAGPAPQATAQAAPAISRGTIVAVMPGKVIRILVKPGQRVEIGEPVCVLEAMKMENELRAPEAGIVRAVYVNPGDDVRKDQPLVEIA